MNNSRTINSSGIKSQFSSFPQQHEQFPYLQHSIQPHLSRNSQSQIFKQSPFPHQFDEISAEPHLSRNSQSHSQRLNEASSESHLSRNPISYSRNVPQSLPLPQQFDEISAEPHLSRNIQHLPIHYPLPDHLRDDNQKYESLKCSCYGHFLKSPEGQRPINFERVEAIRHKLSIKSLRLISAIISTPFISYTQDGDSPMEYLIIDGQHRIEALKEECKRGNHIKFTYKFENYSKKEAYEAYYENLQYEPHMNIQKNALSEKEAIFVNQSMHYLKDLQKQGRVKEGVKRPNVNFGLLIETLKSKCQVDINKFDINKFVAIINNVNSKIRNWVNTRDDTGERWPFGGCPEQSTISRCKNLDFFIGMISMNDYHRLSL